MGSMMTLVAFLPFWLAFHIGVYKIFQKAGIEGWKAFIPIYWMWPLVKMIGKPWWWFVVAIIPIVGVVMMLAMYIEVSKSFKKDKIKHHIAALLVPFAYFPYLGFSKKAQFAGVPAEIYKGRKKSAVREWTEAIIFAIIAATLIRTFFIEPYTIPTPSMEKTLLTGDFLFASKVHYGTRIPMTPLHIPLVHHTVPILGIKSYLDWFKLPYWRLPGFQDVQRNDIFIFNFPEGDTVVNNFSGDSYYALTRSPGAKKRLLDRDLVRDPQDGIMKQGGGITTRPVDKKDNYIKRCVAIPGDSLRIVDGILWVRPKDGEWEQSPHFKKMQRKYIVYTDRQLLSAEQLLDMDITPHDVRAVYNPDDQTRFEYFVIDTYEENIEKLKALPQVTSVKLRPTTDIYFGDRIFPNTPTLYDWNSDNYGPIYIPEKGDILEINPLSLPFYKRLIEVYEGHEVKTDGPKVFIDGNETTTYEVEMDYFWAMGDNRDNSLDSRFWGYVPEDHIVGKAWFIWMSWDKYGGSFFKKIRWNRLFRPIN